MAGSANGGNGNGLLPPNSGYRSADIQELARDLTPIIRAENQYVLRVAVMRAADLTQRQIMAQIGGTELEIRAATERLERCRERMLPAPESLSR